MGIMKKIFLMLLGYTSFVFTGHGPEMTIKTHLLFRKFYGQRNEYSTEDNLSLNGLQGKKVFVVESGGSSRCIDEALVLSKIMQNRRCKIVAVVDHKGDRKLQQFPVFK